MTYTKEEIKIIKNNIKKIENYCKTEIFPQIDGSISISFFETQYRSNGSAFQKTYGFHIDTKGTPSFTSSALRVVLEETFEGTSTAVNAYQSWHYALELLERWQTVKNKLLDEIHKNHTRKESFLTFQI